MFEDMEDAVDNLVEAIECGRTDIVRTVISTLQSDDYDDEDEDITLDKVLNSLLTDEGTILHFASKENQADIIRTLLSAGADPGIHNHEEKTPLDLVTDPKVKDVYNEEMLQCVAKSDIGRVCQLIAAGVEVNLRDSPVSQNTPLHWAASYGNQSIVQCLCKRGSNVNAVNIDGVSPLHDAVIRGDNGVIEELLSSGASVSIRPSSGKMQGKTPLDISVEKPDIFNLMKKYTSEISNGDVLNGSSGLANGTVTDEAEDTSMATASPEHSQTPNFPDTRETPTPGPQAPTTPVTPAVPNGSLPTLLMPNKGIGGDSLLISNSVAPPETLVTDGRLHMLWPRPKKLVQKEGKAFQIKESLSVYLTQASSQNDQSKRIKKTWRQHELDFKLLNLGLCLETVAACIPLVPSHVLCEVNRRLFALEESYRLSVRDSQVKIQASDQVGLHYGICTFLQLLKLCKEEGIPPLQIHDHPTISQRAVLLDMSKGRLPDPEILKQLIRTLSYLKINQVQIYTRVVVPNDPSLRWQFSYTRSTLLELDEFCSDHFITMVPVLDVSPKVGFSNIGSLVPTFHQFITCFTSSSLIGVGPRLSGFLLDIENGVLIDDSRRLLPISPDQTVQLCAYIFHEFPQCLQQLPPNTILADYGFQAGQDFHKNSVMFSEAGVPFCIVPGTAAWNSLAGCPEAAVSNIHNAVQSLVSQGGLGLVTSHWAGIGHLTHLPICYPGLVTTAGLAWNPDIHLEYLHANLAELINAHVLLDTAQITGQVIIELGRAETFVLRCARNQAGTDISDLPAERGSLFYQLLANPDEVDLENLTTETFQKAMRHIRKCQNELSKAQMTCNEASVVLGELQLTADLMLSACRIGRALVNAGKNPSGSGLKVVNMGIANLLPTSKTDLANRLLSQLETYRSVWLSRNLPQHLQESLLTFSAILQPFVPEGQTQEQFTSLTGMK